MLRGILPVLCVELGNARSLRLELDRVLFAGLAIGLVALGRDLGRGELVGLELRARAVDMAEEVGAGESDEQSEDKPRVHCEPPSAALARAGRVRPVRIINTRSSARCLSRASFPMNRGQAESIISSAAAS